MRHQADQDFWKAYEALPQGTRDLADKAFVLLKKNSKHPSLHFKKIGRRWSVRVSAKYRALALEIDDGFLWYWIGPHDAYERMIRE
jgi:hypothetical protein